MRIDKKMGNIHIYFTKLEKEKVFQRFKIRIEKNTEAYICQFVLYLFGRFINITYFRVR